MGGTWYGGTLTNYTWTTGNTSNTVTIHPTMQSVSNPPPPKLREKTALEKLDDRINDVRVLVAR